MDRLYAHHYEYAMPVAAPPEAVFAHADQPKHLSSHMSERAVALGGSAMHISGDSVEGRTVGSRMSLSGKVMGYELYVEAVVTERVPSSRKVWETVGKPRLLVVGPYRMGFEISPFTNGCSFRAFIDYDLPMEGFSRFLGFCLGRWYAKWCVRRMVQDTAREVARG